MALGREDLQELELRIIRGDDFEFGFTVYDRVAEGTPGAINLGVDSGGGTIWGLVKDLTDYTALAQIRPGVDSSTVEATFTVSRESDGSGALDDSGIVWLTLTPAQSAAVSDGSVSDFELTAPPGAGGKKRTYFKMKFPVTKDVSHA